MQHARLIQGVFIKQLHFNRFMLIGLASFKIKLTLSDPEAPEGCQEDRRAKLLHASLIVLKENRLTLQKHLFFSGVGHLFYYI